MTTGYVVAHKMRPWSETSSTPTLRAMVAAYPPTDPVTEGNNIAFNLRRSRSLAAPVSVTWTVSTPGGAADLPGTLTGTAEFAVGVADAPVFIATANRTGVQGDRVVTITLSDPVGCDLDPAKTTATATIVDRTVVAPEWWKAKTSKARRNWTSGCAFFGSKWTDYAEKVAWPDCIVESNVGAANAKIADWDKCAGGTTTDLDGITAGSQFDWTGSDTGWNLIWNAHTANELWLGFTFVPLPTTYNLATSATILDDIIAGTHDLRFQGMGRRIKANFTSKGVDLKYFLGRPFPEMNLPCHYQMTATNKAKWKSAFERIITKIREGADYPSLRFGWCPARNKDSGGALGTLADLIPAGVDFLDPSIYAASGVTDLTTFNALFTGNTTFWGVNEFATEASNLSIPMAHMSWCPRVATNTIADQVIGWFYNNYLLTNYSKIVADCFFGPQILDATAADSEPAQTTAGKAAWAAAVTSFASLWTGTRRPSTPAAPTADDFTATTTSGSSSAIDVLAHATGDSLTISAVGTPSSGSAAISSGRVTYTARKGWTGIATFTYTVRDSLGREATGTVSVTVSSGTARDWFHNPFIARSAHWRGVGANATYGAPAYVHIKDWEQGRYDTLTGGCDETTWRNDWLPKIGAWETGASYQGLKFFYEVSSSDTDAAGSATGKQTFREYDEVKQPDGSYQIRWTNRTKQLKVPRGTIALPSTAGVHYPPNNNGGDYEESFAFRDGGTDPILDTFIQFMGPADAVRVRDALPAGVLQLGEMGYDAWSEWRLDGSDTPETAGDRGASASQVRWPGCLITDELNNVNNPRDILHCIHVTGTRHNKAGATNACHVLASGIVHPAHGVDGSLRQMWLPTASAAQVAERANTNQGIHPYGCKWVIKPSDYTTIKNHFDSDGNKIGLKLLVCMIDFGCYLLDGQGQTVTIGSTKKGKLQTRITGITGRNPDGSTIPNVIAKMDAAFAYMLPYIVPIRNPQRWTQLDSEHYNNPGHAAHGLFFTGGGGPVRGASATLATPYVRGL